MSSDIPPAIVGLDGKPLRAEPKPQPKTRPEKRREDRKLQKDLKKAMKEDPTIQARVVDHCQKMLKEAKVPCALVAFPSVHGEKKAVTYLTMDNHDLIKFQIDEHEKRYDNERKNKEAEQSKQ